MIAVIFEVRPADGRKDDCVKRAITTFANGWAVASNC
jgi:hypothetical protein